DQAAHVAGARRARPPRSAGRRRRRRAARARSAGRAPGCRGRLRERRGGPRALWRDDPAAARGSRPAARGLRDPGGSMSKLAGKVAVVTGSGRGIGAAIAIRYAQEGAKVVVADILGDNAAAVAERITAAGGDAIAVTTDVSKPDDVDALIAATLDAFGGLHVMLNNAGM